MAMRVFLIEVPGDHVLRIRRVDTHFLQPFFGELSHEAVAFLAVGEASGIFRGERDGNVLYRLA